MRERTQLAAHAAVSILLSLAFNSLLRREFYLEINGTIDGLALSICLHICLSVSQGTYISPDVSWGMRIISRVGAMGTVL